MNHDLDALAAVAVEAARRAGAIQRGLFGGTVNVDRRLANDIKLEADRLCEEAIVAVVRGAFPSHAILAEEGGATGGSGHVWYVDPLDGTVNFYYGIPYFCTTLACYASDAGEAGGMGTPLVGVTFAPLADELFVAARGRGATLNGVAIRMREESVLAESLLLTAIGNYDGKLDFMLETTMPLSRRVFKLRNLGACAYDLANVAAGRASGFFEYAVNPWDIAAGRILVEEAGGAFGAEALPGGKVTVAAAGGAIYGELAAAVFAGRR